MKRLKYLVLICGVVLLTACGGAESSKNDDTNTKELVCKQSVVDEDSEVVVTLENGKVVKISGEVTLKSKEEAETYASILGQLSATKNEDAGVKVEDNKVIVENYHIVVEVLGGKDAKVIGATEEEIKNLLIHQNFKCD